MKPDCRLVGGVPNNMPLVQTQRVHLSQPHHTITGGVGAEYTVSGTSWSALTLEAGKSPTATTRRAELPV